MIRQAESLIDRMRWKYFFAQKRDEELDLDKTVVEINEEEEEELETDAIGLSKLRLKSFKKPGKSSSVHLNNFETDLISAITNLKGRNLPPKQAVFDREIKKSIKEACPKGNIILFGDKSTNKYTIGTDQWKEILNQLLMAGYRKINHDRLITLNQLELETAQKLELEAFLPPILISPAYFTLKDHKPDFLRLIPSEHCRLINPSKSYLGKIVNFRVKEILKKLKPLNQQRTVFTNTSDAIDWLKRIKSNRSGREEERLGTTLDIKSYYPNIKAELIEKALAWAATSVSIPEDTLPLIKQASIGLLYDGHQLWERLGGFEITQGGFHSAALADLTSAYINFMIGEAANKESGFERFQWGIFKDDLILYWEGRSMRQREKFLKMVCSVIKSLGFSVKVNLWLPKAEFLDVEMDFGELENDAYMKPNNTPLYVNANSNHHPKILKNLPANILGRVINITSRESNINTALKPYQEALVKANHRKIKEISEQLINVRKSGQDKTVKKSKAKRQVIWFTPPYNGRFHGIGLTELINKHFVHGIKDNNGIYTRRLFNPRTVRASASNAPNLEKIIKAHNARNLASPGKRSPNWEIFSSGEEKAANCSCRQECPLNGNCHRKNCVYMATISTTDTDQPEQQPTTTHYIGSTIDFKERVTAHLNSIKKPATTNKTTLSSFIHGLKESEKATVKWEIIEEDLETFNGRYCNLCDTEKYHLISSPKNLINKRHEISNGCKHRSTGPFYLPNWEMPKIAAMREKDRLRMRRGRLKVAAEKKRKRVGGE